MEQYDFIILGCGTAGSVLASRLSDNAETRVLVIEAGGMDQNFWLKLPVGYFKTIHNKSVIRQFKGEADAGIQGRKMEIPRGRVAGGSSSINGLIYMRGQHQDFDDWEKLGATGWSHRDVLPHFKSIEKFEGDPNEFRGTTGPLNVSKLKNDNFLCRAWIDAASQFGLPYNVDFNSETTFGIGSYQLTLNGRWRESAATAFLHPALSRSNLRLINHATVTSLIFENKVAKGVRYTLNGIEKTAYANKEIVLSAGAIQSPQILMLSGIGPGDMLRHYGIPVIYDAPDVGENLQDHLQMRTIVELKNGKHSLNRQIRNPFKLAYFGLEWVIRARGPLTVGAGQVGGAICTKYATDGRPDIQLFVMPLSVDKPGKPLHRFPGFTVSYWQCHPESRGRITLKSCNPYDAPKIETNYLDCAKDQNVMVEGMKIVRRIYNQNAFRNLWKDEVVPGMQFSTDEKILEAIRQNAGTVYHPVGTCRMGSDDKAVVDHELRVKGVRRLRVVDASIMPKITSANTNAASLMIAEKAASLINNDN